MNAKRCHKCSKDLPLTNFRVCSNGKIKRVSSYCNNCAVEYTRARRATKAKVRALETVLDLEGEIWKNIDIDGFGAHYLVSNHSRIKSKYRQVKCGNKTISVFEKILKTSNLKGYRAVELKSDEGESKKILVHRIVAIAFIPNPDNKPAVNHKNGNKSDNSIDNLEWCTLSENSLHAWNEIKTMKPYMGAEKKVKQLSLTGEVIKIWDSATKAANALNLSQGNISSVARGERRVCGNYNWEYAN